MHLEALKKGRPVFAGSEDGVRIGIATRKDVVASGEPVMVDLWIDNRTDTPTPGCSRCENVPLWAVEVFDESGRRLVSIHEQRELDDKKAGIERMEVCSGIRIAATIPPHTCRAPAEGGGSNWMLDYKLAPGRYYVFPTMGTDPRLYKQGLLITVW
jgi:hypothetical protein